MTRETDYFSLTLCLNRLTHISHAETPPPEESEKATNTIHLENDEYSR
jgi:hypothetical protein